MPLPNINENTFEEFGLHLLGDTFLYEGTDAFTELNLLANVVIQYALSHYFSPKVNCHLDIVLLHVALG